jgi:hypothetical protein
VTGNGINGIHPVMMRVERHTVMMYIPFSAASSLFCVSHLFNFETLIISWPRNFLAPTKIFQDS